MRPKTWPMPDCVTIALPWARPPLLSNDRMDDHVRNRLKRQIKDDAHVLGLQQFRRYGTLLGPLHITFGWAVVVEGLIRDADNIQATGKPALDGLVRSGLIADDRWQIVPAVTYRIRKAATRQTCYVQIRLDNDAEPF